jgi:hypothetical protein
MNLRRLNTENGKYRARSVLECGGPPPLLTRRTRSDIAESARGLAQSKSWRRLATTFAFCLLPLGFCFQASAQYSIDWSTIDGGGGTSTGGVYSIGGTIGQPDAVTMSGGNYMLQGGFWGIIAAVQTPGAPLLSIARTSTNTVAVFWPWPSTGWGLQQNTNSVSSVNWSNVTGVIQDDGTNRSLIVNPPIGNRFYRLHKP